MIGERLPLSCWTMSWDLKRIVLLQIGGSDMILISEPVGIKLNAPIKTHTHVFFSDLPPLMPSTTLLLIPPLQTIMWWLSLLMMWVQFRWKIWWSIFLNEKLLSVLISFILVRDYWSQSTTDAWEYWGGGSGVTHHPHTLSGGVEEQRRYICYTLGYACSRAVHHSAGFNTNIWYSFC